MAPRFRSLPPEGALSGFGRPGVTEMDAAHIIWLVVLLIVVVVIVPLAIHLLHRTLTAAQSIRRYLDDMLVAGVGIAGNTAAIPALDETLRVAGAMVGVAGDLDAHSATIASVLSSRAHGGRAA